MRYTCGISICKVPELLAEAELTLSQLAEGPRKASISAEHEPAGRKPSLSEIYWIAGELEGDGSFAGSEVKIPQKEPEVLLQVLDLFGGRIISRDDQGTRGDRCPWS